MRTLNPESRVDRIFRDRDDLGFPLEIVGQEEALPASDRALRFPFRRSHPRRSHPEQGSVWEEVVVELGWEPSLLSTLLTQLIVGPTERLREALTSFRYLGPLREPPPRNYEPPRSPDPSRWPSGLAAWDLLSRDAKLVEEASIWLSDEKRLDAGYGLRLFEYKELPIESPAFVRIGSTPDIDDLDMLKEEVVSLDTKRNWFSQRRLLMCYPPTSALGYPSWYQSLDSQSTLKQEWPLSSNPNFTYIPGSRPTWEISSSTGQPRGETIHPRDSQRAPHPPDSAKNP